MRHARVGFYFLASGALWAQQYVISTYAGGAPQPTPVLGTSMSLAGAIQGVATDAGNIYFASGQSVFKLDPKGILTRVAGNSRLGYSGDGGPATSAQLSNPAGVALDRLGNLFICDLGNSRLRRVSPSGIITTVAGTGTSGSFGDGGPATNAQLNYPVSVAADGAGNLFLADSVNGQVRKVSPSGIITTVAGGGGDYPGDGGPATSAAIIDPRAVAVDAKGNLFIADGPGTRVRKVSPGGIITTVAGNGMPGYSGDGGPATAAQLYFVIGIAADAFGNVFIADGNRVRKVASSGIITTVAGTGPVYQYGFSGDGGPATAAQIVPTSVSLDALGNLFIADASLRLRKVSTDGTITTVAGDGAGACCFSGDGGPALSAQLASPVDVAVDGDGNVFVDDLYNHRIRKISPAGIMTTVAGDGTLCATAPSDCLPPGDFGPATAAQLSQPLGIAADNSGNLFIVDATNNRVRKVSPGGIITTVAGNGGSESSGDGGPATAASLAYPLRVAVDGAGNLFIITPLNVRRVTPDGVITTVAGNGKLGFSGDGGPATAAELEPDDVVSCDGPGGGMAVDSAGDLIVADTYNNRVREVSFNGTIATIAGNGTAGYSGDGGPAMSAQLAEPFAAAFDATGNLFIADLENNRIRKISPSGTISTVAGSGTSAYGFSGDGGAATSALLGGPHGIATDSAGDIYFADTFNNTVRVLRPTHHSVVISAVVDAASQSATPFSPGKIVVIYGAGLGPSQLAPNQPKDGQFGTQAGGTTVAFNGIAAPVLYAWTTQVAAIVPYSATGMTAQVTVAYQGETSAAFTIPLAVSSPSLFTSNQTGAGQAAAVNADGTVNTAANPAKIGGYISLYATGEGQTSPGGVDGKLAGSTAPNPLLPVSVTVGGIPATVQYKGGAPGEVAGLMQVNVQIPSGVQPGGYVPVVLQVGDSSTTPGAVWIAVSGN